ncbi:hypothetical protein CPB83DRAFT_908443 [Crepidotus variabilis]|uniref:SAM domain-containing protein n=1 Tax=Crepidotus variabilis TaxID=179855 RepID=A0A9P6EBG3_9AGAR|nr:hypothetical protein CPB83DRAFT_908443 [Crepidotus variabilis]
MPATPSPSSSGFHFPGSAQKKEQPNAHPYAIRTSSTAILSRSNSTSSNASVGAHHYIPSSPSPAATKHAAVKHHRPSRHRYSRSLTSDNPQPLPPPPSGVSPSPTREMFSEEPEVYDDTPTRRNQRAETLPSSVGAPVQHVDLPDDPKSWTPSQVSTYLSSTLRAGSANLPGPVAKDIATFIRERRITGRIFLRLSEDDLIQFGVNQLWRTTLLTASRGLRQTILRGRIWGFGNTPTSPQDEEDQGNLSSSSSNLSSGGLGPSSAGRRSRHSSTASSSSERNRVQDLIESLERSSSAQSGMDEEGTTSEYNGRRSLSPTKLSGNGNHFSSNQHHSNYVSASPKPHGGRALPARGTVNNLFSPAQMEAEIAVEEKEDDPTIKQVARKNIHGREPRMLPFPPTHGGMMSPTHTGGSGGYQYPQALTPDQSGSTTFSSTMYTSSSPAIPSDFEMGFRPRVYSPHSQAYMVRHNPASPSNSGSGGKRLLPFPPVTGENQLHHPKPRRLVGTNTGVDDLDELEENIVAGGYESESESRLGTIKATSSMSASDTNTDAYTTASEGRSGQSDTNSIFSNGTAYQRAEDEEEEPSMEELLASQEDISAATLSNSISGVEAWEMELGDTVKRIGGKESLSPSSKANAKRGSNGSVAEIGRKAGRNKTGTIGTMGSKKDGDGLKRGGIMGLFDLQPPAEQEPQGVEEEVHAAPPAEKVQQVIDDRLNLLEDRERLVRSREEAVTLREEDVGRREVAFEQSRSSWKMRQASEEEQLSLGFKDVRDQAEEIEHRERNLKAKEQAVGVKEDSLRRKEAEIRRKEEEVDSSKKRVAEKEEMIVEEERRRAALDGMENALWPIPLGLLRKCWGTFVLPIVGEDRTPAFLHPSVAKRPSELTEAPASSSSSTNGHGHQHTNGAASSTSAPYRTSTWSIKRDMFLGRAPGGGYLVLMSIGVCVVALRVLSKRAGGVVGNRR